MRDQLKRRTTRALLPGGRVIGDWPGTLGDLTEFVIERFPGCLVIAEQPMYSPSMPHLPQDVFDRAVRGEDVFAVCTTNSPRPVVVRALNAQDPTYLYCVFVLKDNATTRAWVRSETDEFVSDTADLRLVIVGAYDGEGFVMLAPDDPFTGS